MIAFAKYAADGTVMAGPIEGRDWTGITPTSRFWPEVEAWEADGNEIAPYEAPAPTADAYSAAIQRHLDAKAQERQYDSIQTGVTYRDDPNPQFAAEGAALFTWRSAVWTYALAELDKVQTGQREPPTIEDLIGELPAMEWPD